MTTVTVEDVSKSFSRDGSVLTVLKHVSFSLRDGEFVCLVGPNGSGKSTLLNLLAGILVPEQGSVSVQPSGGRERARIGYAWQDYRSSLLPWRTVGANLAFPLEVSGTQPAERHRVAAQLLAEFAPELQLGHRTDALSGGQLQLISVLRSFVADPDLVLMDEPLSALDQQRRWSLAFHIERAWRKRRPPTVFVSHDIDEAVLLADRILLLGVRGSGVTRELQNSLPRPRSLEMLKDQAHIVLRNEIIDFLAQHQSHADPLNGI